MQAGQPPRLDRTALPLHSAHAHHRRGKSHSLLPRVGQAVPRLAEERAVPGHGGGGVAACQRAGWTGWAHADSGSPDGARNELHDGDAEHKPRHGSWRCREGLGTCDGAGTRSTVYTAMDTGVHSERERRRSRRFSKQMVVSGEVELLTAAGLGASWVRATLQRKADVRLACLWSPVGVGLTAQFTSSASAGHASCTLLPRHHVATHTDAAPAALANMAPAIT